MSTDFLLKRRGVGGPAGAPSSLKSGQIAYNMADGYFYVGYGDDGNGNATSIKIFAAHDFSISKLLPPGGSLGQLLGKKSNTDFDVQWVNPPEGGVEPTGGDGIDVTNGVISVDPTTMPGLDASKITSGTFDPARIPVLQANKTIVSSGGIADLTSGQQADIVEGTHVTTTDGRRWVYSGSGSKTSEASYIELADVTPDWSVIANKPSFATVATSGAYGDLTGRPTLGTMASQDANSVNITGGTIDGVTLDGGTF